MSKSVVAIVKGTDPEEMMSRLLDHLGGVESLIRPGSTVVLKPNAGHEFGPETSVCTSPAVVKAAIKEIRRAKPKEIIVAEASAIGCDTMKCFEISGILKAAEDAGADRIVDIKKEKNLILMGDCVKKFRDKGLWVVGCPPTEPSTGWAIIDRKIYNGPEDLDFDPQERGLIEEEKLIEYAKQKRKEMNR